jgi:hypothetical protein
MFKTDCFVRILKGFRDLEKCERGIFSVEFVGAKACHCEERGDEAILFCKPIGVMVQGLLRLRSQ